MQTERAKRMDSAGEAASLNSPELPWNQLYLKRRTESRIQLRRRVCFTGPAAASVTWVLAILILAAGSVSSDSKFVTVPSSVNCTEGQDCILSCSFNYTAGGWNEKSGVTWEIARTHRTVHRYNNNTDQLADQLSQYVNRTSLFDSELQRGNASLLLRTVREKDYGGYSCYVNAVLYGSGQTLLVLVSSHNTPAVTVPDKHPTESTDVKGLGKKYLWVLVICILLLCAILCCCCCCCCCYRQVITAACPFCLRSNNARYTQPQVMAMEQVP